MLSHLTVFLYVSVQPLAPRGCSPRQKYQKKVARSEPKGTLERLLLPTDTGYLVSALRRQSVRSRTLVYWMSSTRHFIIFHSTLSSRGVDATYLGILVTSSSQAVYPSALCAKCFSMQPTSTSHKSLTARRCHNNAMRNTNTYSNVVSQVACLQSRSIRSIYYLKAISKGFLHGIMPNTHLTGVNVLPHTKSIFS